MSQKTYSVKPTDVTRKWYVIDASQATLGRISTQAATLLLGKRKPTFSHHIDVGDYVIIINADKMSVTGDKLDSKMYYTHSGYPGALKELTLTQKMERDITSPLFLSIRGMLPVNKLRDPRLARLKIYAGAEHNHAAQTPELIDLQKGTV